MSWPCVSDEGRYESCRTRAADGCWHRHSRGCTRSRSSSSDTLIVTVGLVIVAFGALAHSIAAKPLADETDPSQAQSTLQTGNNNLVLVSASGSSPNDPVSAATDERLLAGLNESLSRFLQTGERQRQERVGADRPAVAVATTRASGNTSKSLQQQQQQQQQIVALKKISCDKLSLVVMAQRVLNDSVSSDALKRLADCRQQNLLDLELMEMVERSTSRQLAAMQPLQHLDSSSSPSLPATVAKSDIGGRAESNTSHVISDNSSNNSNISGANQTKNGGNGQRDRASVRQQQQAPECALGYDQSGATTCKPSPKSTTSHPEADGLHLGAKLAISLLVIGLALVGTTTIVDYQLINSAGNQQPDRDHQQTVMPANQDHDECTHSDHGSFSTLASSNPTSRRRETNGGRFFLDLGPAQAPKLRDYRSLSISSNCSSNFACSTNSVASSSAPILANGQPHGPPHNHAHNQHNHHHQQQQSHTQTCTNQYESNLQLHLSQDHTTGHECITKKLGRMEPGCCEHARRAGTNKKVCNKNNHNTTSTTIGALLADDGLVSQILLAFSLRRTLGQIFEQQPANQNWARCRQQQQGPATATASGSRNQHDDGQQESVDSLHGLRFLSMIWVIIIHSYNFALRWMFFSNTSTLDGIYKSTASQFIANGSFACDSFFFVGGFLLPYLALRPSSSSSSSSLAPASPSVVEHSGDDGGDTLSEQHAPPHNQKPANQHQQQQQQQVQQQVAVMNCDRVVGHAEEALTRSAEHSASGGTITSESATAAGKTGCSCCCTWRACGCSSVSVSNGSESSNLTVPSSRHLRACRLHNHHHHRQSQLGVGFLVSSMCTLDECPTTSTGGACCCCGCCRLSGSSACLGCQRFRPPPLGLQDDAHAHDDGGPLESQNETVVATSSGSSSSTSLDNTRVLVTEAHSCACASEQNNNNNNDHTAAIGSPCKRRLGQNTNELGNIIITTPASSTTTTNHHLPNGIEDLNLETGNSRQQQRADGKTIGYQTNKRQHDQASRLTPQSPVQARRSFARKRTAASMQDGVTSSTAATCGGGSNECGGDGQFTWRRCVANVVRRYVRMMPLMMAIIGLCVSLLRYLGDGPVWQESTMMYDHWCRRNWWVNALFLHNFVNRENMCLSHSWYSAVDFQLFLLGQLILYVIHRNRRAGLLLLFGLLFGSPLITMALTIKHHLPAVPLIASVNEQTMNLYYGEIYIKPYSRASPHLIGILLAYLMRTTSLGQWRLKKWQVFAGWTLAISLLLAIILAMQPAMNGHTPSELESALYSGWSRPLWACATGWIIFACITKQAGPIGRLLGARCFVPLSRLTYPAFLIHPIIMASFYGTRQASFQFSHYLMLYLILGNIVITYASAFILAALIELPFLSIERVVSRRLFKTN